MAHSHDHPIYSQAATVYLVRGDEKLKTFQRTVEQAGFVQHVLDHWQASGRAQSDFRIAIKPNIMTASKFQENSPVYTDPVLVEALVALLREAGFTRFSVVESQNVYNYAYQERTVPAVAAMCGYSEDNYAIVDLTADTVDLDYGGVLGQHKAGRAWVESDYRISFAKNKTHWQCYFTACLKNVYGCLPQWDKMRHYHGKTTRGGDIEFYQATILINDVLPVHFAFLDAWISGDGLTGHVRDAHPNPTHTFLASTNAYALDWVAGELMRLDPEKNAVIREAVRTWGKPTITRVGDATPWRNWHNVRPIVVWAFDWIEERYWLSRFMSRAAATEMDPRFPPRGRFAWFFRICQAFVRFGERLLARATE
jgi:uncharacterized protein (DUF362 family)